MLKQHRAVGVAFVFGGVQLLWNQVEIIPASNLGDSTTTHIRTTARYRDSRLVQIGLGGILLGSGPLLLAVIVGHLKGDPNPNPLGPGILCGFTFFPSFVSLAIGVAMVALRRKSVASSNPRPL